ncbi:AMP-binding protein [Litchfieldella qijiaojingensis]|uniref:AMP-binding protein n=1 Tax=Litchfieldella qijiaojingensis TaxID=980347 RepID=A0ABQ2YKI8_9GAMM|nr:AMP-binding protein [Halomonas qijiaojingensis]GGX86765.1 AMP-binding protein [Halomonas qijiaojingensis]
MTFVPLTRLPWRRANKNHRSLPHHWVDPISLPRRIDAWRHWLDDQPGGRWLLCQRHPEDFCAALIALWESGRIAVLPADDRPETLSRLAAEADGTLPDTPGDHSVSQHEAAALAYPEALAPASTAVVLYTSGSTGDPVRLAKRFDQLDAELAAHADLWPLTGSCVISQVSHQHIYGLLTGVLHPLCAGILFCGDESRYPEVLAARIQEAGDAGLAPVVVSSPAQLSRLPEHLPWGESPHPTRVFSSGAPLAAEHAQHAERLLRTTVIEIYGSTETGGIAHRRQTQDISWQALPGVQLSLSNEHLTLRSPFLEDPGSWWQQPDRVAPTTDGFELLGRVDRVVKIAGKRVSLDRVERTLADMPEVHEARCVDLDRADGRLGVVVALQDEAVPHQHDTRYALIQRLRARLSPHLERVAIPRYWRFVDALPSNAQGKLDRSLINRLFADLDDTKAPRWLGERHPDPSSCLLTLEVPERLIFLEGHFEEYPLVPGVVMVQWAIELAGESFGELGEFQGVERLKFQRVLRPGVRFTLRLTRRNDGIAFAIDSHEGRHCAGQVRLQAQGGGRHG